MNVETEEQILIYDFSAIVAGVGGSLGLFLGFSCLQAFDPALEKIKGSFKNQGHWSLNFSQSETELKSQN